MLILRDVALLAAPTLRSRAYAQMLAAAGLLPSLLLRLPGKEPEWDGDVEYQVPDLGGLRLGTFRPGERVEDTLLEVPSVSLSTSDINHPDASRRLERLSQKVVIYSGMSGAILRDEVLDCGPRFLHVHGGSAPAFRGSTAFYFELLERGQFGVTALWLERELDTGPRLAQRAFTPPRGFEFDRVLDPMVRAALLVEVLESYSRTGAFPSLDSAGTGRVHYVIHPVLKHVALRRYSREPDPRD